MSDSAWGSPQTSSLSGTGLLPLTLSPGSLTFPATHPTATSAAMTITVKNIQSGALTITGISTSGDFAQTSNCPLSPNTLAASSTCTISVTFTPTALGTRTGTLTVTNGSSTYPQTANLSGTGTLVGLSAISLTPVNPTVFVGKQQQMTATGTFANGSTLNVSNYVNWSSSVPAFAPVTSTGLVQALAQGVTAITASNSDCYNGCGTLFKITPGGTFTTLHKFDGTDGYAPYGGLVQGTDGNFYGTTIVGGANGDGTVFKITPGGAVTTLHSFDGTDGSNFKGGLVQATDGNFYGTTMQGGANGYGTVFKITPGGTLTTLHSFDGTDGYGPYGTLLQATNGTFYGTTSYCNLYSYPTCGDCPTLSCGTVFSLSVGLGQFVSFLPAVRTVGQTIQILGQGFTGATGVSFNGTAAAFTVKSDTFLTATVPAGATTGNIYRD